MIKQNKRFGIAFAAPVIVLLLVFMIYPLLSSIFYSFTDYYLLDPTKISFVGVQNYKILFQDLAVLEAFKNTIALVLTIVTIQIPMSLLLALMVNKPKFGNDFFRLAFFSPVILSIVVVSLLWTNLLNPDPQYGMINSLLVSLGFSTQQFLRSSNQALGTIAFLTIWQAVGFQMLIFLQALQSIDSTMYEAAEIDGANFFHCLKFVTLPTLKPTIAFVSLTVLIDAFKVVIQPLILTNGGPEGATSTIVFYLFQQTKYNMIGYASAISVLLAVLLIVLSIIQNKIFKED